MGNRSTHEKIETVKMFKKRKSALNKNGLHFIFNNKLDRTSRHPFRPAMDEKRRSPLGAKLARPLLDQSPFERLLLN